MQKIESDIIVVGGGMSGLAAAAQAAELGASVTILEKSGTFGGAANMGTGFAAVESHIQDTAMITLTVQDAFEEFMEYSHWKIDPILVRRFWGLSAGTVKWVEKMGVEFLGAFKYFHDSRATWHMVKVPGSDKPAERSGAILQKCLVEYVEQLGVNICYNTAVREILMEAGHAVGVRARHDGSEELEAYGDAVIVGTGGFVNCPEMALLCFGTDGLEDGPGFGIPGLEGDGLRMCWAAGGAKASIFKRGDAFVVGLTDIFKTLGETMHQYNLMVDMNGKRFMNEVVLSNADYLYNIVNARKGRQIFNIINDEILDYYKENGLEYVTVQHNIRSIDDWDKEMDLYLRGESIDNPLAAMHENDHRPKGFYVFDTIEELCAALHINEKNLKATLERYNSMAHQFDLDFFKPARYMKPIRGGRYYVARYSPFGCGGLGGVKTDENMSVLNEDGDVIPGLYSTGTDANNLYSEVYNHRYPGGFMGFAINSGRIAGMESVNYLNSDAFQQI